jgi:hypothetical protein
MLVQNDTIAKQHQETKVFLLLFLQKKKNLLFLKKKKQKNFIPPLHQPISRFLTRSERGSLRHKQFLVLSACPASRFLVYAGLPHFQLRISGMSWPCLSI